MPQIHVLDAHVADLIAAGEVVERPASVIKELLENSFDAGAKNVTVELRGGGATYIRVSDDGCGMAPEDAGVAFLRHATSKLQDASGLESIRTMGFRGEALAAISSVSRVELTTRRRGDTEGTRVVLEAGEIQDMLPAGCPEGTTMIVRDLFYNTPARLKFLKTDRSEAAACVQTALRCALGRPEVSVRCLRDGEEEFFSPGDGRAESCVYALLGREMASGLLACSGENGGVRVSGYVSSPAAGRGSRRDQAFFCNGRYIKSSLLQAAVEQAYKNTLLTGRFPACVLYLDVRFSQVDVNVHPAKTEIKFSEEKTVFDAVHYAVLSALSGETRTASVTLSAGTRRAAAVPEREVRAAPPAPAPVSAPRFVAPAPSFGGVLRAQEAVYQTSLELPTRPAPVAPLPAPSAAPRAPEPVKAPVSAEKPAAAPLPTPTDSQIVEKTVQNVENCSLPDHKILGETMKTYILVECGGELLLIDKHAAHERVNFDRLRAQERHIMAQSLLQPQPLRLRADEAELLEQRGALFQELGFEIEPYGERDYMVRAVPAGMDPGQTGAALEEIFDKLRRGRSLSEQEVWDEALHTVACKAAVKAGWDSAPQELERLVEEVLSGRVKYCPHGRPVVVALSRHDLDKMFKRIV